MPMHQGQAADQALNDAIVTSIAERLVKYSHLNPPIGLELHSVALPGRKIGTVLGSHLWMICGLAPTKGWR